MPATHNASEVRGMTSQIFSNQKSLCMTSQLFGQPGANQKSMCRHAKGTDKLIICYKREIKHINKTAIFYYFPKYLFKKQCK